jgi:hypothetical protein
MRLFCEFKGKQTRISYDPKAKTFTSLTVADVNVSQSAEKKPRPQKDKATKPAQKPDQS